GRGGGAVGRAADDVAGLLAPRARHERLGICLDSCHWWVSGVDVTDPDALDEALAPLDHAIGVGRPPCRPAHDAAAPLGSNRDRHASLMLGEMKRGLATFV